ncbi:MULTISPECIES: hypothetical protein [Actinomyces]|uniref:Uncharacterized protein n=1 Tax=Actinomyces respiraculi TaxID=2744574 RepID=A0A7T0LM99_9ACTO|nr:MULTISPECIES: hypothetical protein [Actinomyces]QPL06242.1 hypothetical protein ID810_04885 [Actinomyces respiraculi]
MSDSDSSQPSSCTAEPTALTRDELTAEDQTIEEVLSNSNTVETNDLIGSGIHVQSGFEASQGEISVVVTLGRLDDGTFVAMRRTYETDDPSSTLALSAFEVTDNGRASDGPELSEILTVMPSSDDSSTLGYQPSCVRFDWSCVQSRCSFAAIGCGFFGGFGYLFCLVATCGPLANSCCLEWGQGNVN